MRTQGGYAHLRQTLGLRERSGNQQHWEKKGVQDMGKLDGKVALITGAGSGIGKATALLFAQEQAKVAVADRVPAGGNETVRMIKGGGGEATFIEADVSREAEVQAMIKATVDVYRRIDILHNNAGIQGPFSPTTELSEETWNSILDTNLKSTFLASKHAIPVMLQQGGGVIINTTSAAGIVGLPYVAAYCASKGGVVQLTRSMALEYAPQNIRINCICPGGTQTPMMEQWIPVDPTAREAFMKSLPGGRAIQPQEIARAVLFLACDDSSSAIGVVLVVDRGWTIA
jgi:NAD(P)-dependent dehydrogenase (short-subunit alcohol dehydrogenase family)